MLNLDGISSASERCKYGYWTFNQYSKLYNVNYKSIEICREDYAKMQSKLILKDYQDCIKYGGGNACKARKP